MQVDAPYISLGREHAQSDLACAPRNEHVARLGQEHRRRNRAAPLASRRSRGRNRHRFDGRRTCKASLELQRKRAQLGDRRLVEPGARLRQQVRCGPPDGVSIVFGHERWRAAMIARGSKVARTLAILPFLMWAQLATGAGGATEVWSSNQVRMSSASTAIFWTSMLVVISNRRWIDRAYSSGLSARPSGPTKLASSASSARSAAESCALQASK